jgi:2-oxo-4-hydroxy-4-carboxy-5-ureidoimidazoline decarboxylase
VAYAIAQLNQMNQAEFVAALGEIYEHTPAIAAQAWNQQPFTDVTELHQTMMAVVQSMSLAEQDALIQAHPDLGSKAKMAIASVQEQAGAGLNQLSPAEFERFQTLNQAYKTKFGFPFIVAVKNHTKASILEAFEQRLKNSLAAEREQALNQIFQIAQFRLLALMTE